MTSLVRSLDISGAELEDSGVLAGRVEIDKGLGGCFLAL